MQENIKYMLLKYKNVAGPYTYAHIHVLALNMDTI